MTQKKAARSLFVLQLLLETRRKRRVSHFSSFLPTSAKTKHYSMIPLDISQRLLLRNDLAALVVAQQEQHAAAHQRQHQISSLFLFPRPPSVSSSSMRAPPSRYHPCSMAGIIQATNGIVSCGCGIPLISDQRNNGQHQIMINKLLLSSVAGGSSREEIVARTTHHHQQQVHRFLEATADACNRVLVKNSESQPTQEGENTDRRRSKNNTTTSTPRPTISSGLKKKARASCWPTSSSSSATPTAVTTSGNTAVVPNSDKNNDNKKTSSSKWISTFEELKQYKDRFGDCIVPRGYPENARLASWVAEQRKQYKLFKSGKPSSISHERIRILEKLDFAWNAQEAAWDRQLNDLIKFRQENGHCHVPLSHTKFPRLGLWVKEQRRHYSLRKQGKKSHMTDQRIKALTGVGFCWDTHEAIWMERFRELTEFKEKYGTCLVPTGYSNNPKLGTWVHHQRRQYKKRKCGKSDCHITKERIQALESLGFVWHPREDTMNSSSVSSDEEDEESSPYSAPSRTSSVCSSRLESDNDKGGFRQELDERPKKRHRAV